MCLFGNLCFTICCTNYFRNDFLCDLKLKPSGKINKNLTEEIIIEIEVVCFLIDLYLHNIHTFDKTL